MSLGCADVTEHAEGEVDQVGPVLLPRGGDLLLALVSVHRPSLVG